MAPFEASGQFFTRIKILYEYFLFLSAAKTNHHILQNVCKYTIKYNYIQELSLLFTIVQTFQHFQLTSY